MSICVSGRISEDENRDMNDKLLENENLSEATKKCLFDIFDDGLV